MVYVRVGTVIYYKIQMRKTFFKIFHGSDKETMRNVGQREEETRAVSLRDMLIGLKEFLS